jgi:hypothetical protein
VNYSYLIDALSINDASTTLQDQAYQGIESAGCVIAYGACTSSYILAYSLDTSFVPTLDFNQSIDFSAGLDPGSNTYFSFREGPTPPGCVEQYTAFYGSLSTLSINAVAPVTEPSTLALFGFGLLGLAGVRALQSRKSGPLFCGLRVLWSSVG